MSTCEKTGDRGTMDFENTRMILASGSPRRDELLQTAGIAHEVIVSDADEQIEETEPALLVEALSQRKAEDVYASVCREAQTDLVVIGADTVVACGGRILGKPKDEEDAAQMLRMLSAGAHHVFTGVTLCAQVGGEKRRMTFSRESTVHVAQLSEEEIRAYIATGEAMDKAGSYGIQGAFMKFVTGIEGDYFNIVGLPVSDVYRGLKQILQ